jgi:hypothetical protein
MYEFVLTKIQEEEFFRFSDSPTMGIDFLNAWVPAFNVWLVENDIEYEVKFCYSSPYIGTEISVILQVQSEADAVRLRLTWS